MSDKPWNHEVPSKGKSMSSSQVKSAKARARAAGRPYPNLVDNMAAMKEDSVDEACWDGYKKVGMKKKGNRMVPNCVPEAVSPAQQAAIAISMKKAGKKPKSANESVEQVDEIVTTRNLTAAERRARDAYLNQHKNKLASYSSRTTDSEDEPKRSYKDYNRQGGDYSDKPSSMSLRHTIGSGYYKKTQMEASEPHSRNKMKPSSRFEGSPELVSTYKKDTPGQSTHRIVKKVIEEVLYECNGNCTCGKKPPVTEAEYQGHQVTLNKPMAGDVKKSKVYVKNEKGNVVKVNFGDKNLSIKKNIPARKRSYCARSGGQGNLGKKTSANYWSRRAWKC